LDKTCKNEIKGNELISFDGDAERPMHNNMAQPVAGHEDEEEKSDIFIHQGIHNIEYIHIMISSPHCLISSVIGVVFSARLMENGVE
jgi:hypothetical protein